VQGSGIGPTFYIILESDLKPVSIVNIVLVPEHTDVQLCDQCEAIKLWALGNKMIINDLRQKKLFFVVQIDLPALQAIDKIKVTKLLGTCHIC